MRPLKLATLVILVWTMDKATSSETIALVLELAMKGGLIAGRLVSKKVVYHSANNLHERYCYGVGDVKTVNNTNRIADILDAATDGIEDDDESLDSILECVLNHMPGIPGDWHVRLAMV